MSSLNLQEVIVGQLAAQMDPNQVVMRDSMASFGTMQRAKALEIKSDAGGRIGDKLAELNDTAPPALRKFYESMLAQLEQA